MQPSARITRLRTRRKIIFAPGLEAAETLLDTITDGFRNYLKGKSAVPAEALLIDRAQLLTGRPGVLSNDFFLNLLDMATEWNQVSPAETPSPASTGKRELRDGPPPAPISSSARSSSSWHSTSTGEKFIGDSIAAWAKAMNLDRFDLKR